MNSEADKINYYFAEGEKLWDTMSAHVVSREFFVLWENVQQPRPFIIDGGSFSLFGQEFRLEGEDEEHVAHYCWDNEEMCAVLALESESWQHKYLLTFDNGRPRIYENPAAFLEKYELEHGEKLEIIYDIISHVKTADPSCDVLSLTKKDYLDALAGLKSDHDKVTVRAMRQLPLFSIKKLIKSAIEDMAPDELSTQLSLPLDGSYALVPADDDATVEPLRNSRAQVKAKTMWEIRLLLDFLSISCSNAYENEQFYALDFKKAEFIGAPSNRAVSVKFDVDGELMVGEGDVLQVYLRGSREPFGSLKIDLYDGSALYGRLRWNDHEDIMSCKNELAARPRKSPHEFIALAIEGLNNWFKLDRAEREIQGALRYILGMEETIIYTGIAADAPGKLDASQQKAWSCAVDSRNPVVIIQGPPGTGKTSVLEQVARKLCSQKMRILITAPSNTAVDNICRRIIDLPVLRMGANMDSIAPDVRHKCWIGVDKNVLRFSEKRREQNTGGIFASTHVGLLRDGVVAGDIEQNGLFDVIIYDEAGMASIPEFLLSSRMGRRVVLFGDHQQLPPFPLPPAVIEKSRRDFGPLTSELNALIGKSALEWLASGRDFPIVMLQCSYRCQNPRLLRFASTLFYDAGVRASRQAEYYQLPYHERQDKYPPSTLKLLKTSALPFELRSEKLIFEGCKPGLENLLEARLCCRTLYDAMSKYPLAEITLISPYRRQVKLIRDMLSREKTMTIIGKDIPPQLWETFLFTRIATVDSFQGGESDIVIISYVRSTQKGNIGFVDDANRINVAHTRCRREMIIIGDMESLKQNSRNHIFVRMERAFERDGEVENISIAEAEALEREYPEPGKKARYEPRNEQVSDFALI